MSDIAIKLPRPADIHTTPTEDEIARELCGVDSTGAPIVGPDGKPSAGLARALATRTGATVRFPLRLAGAEITEGVIVKVLAAVDSAGFHGYRERPAADGAPVIRCEVPR